MVRVGKSFSLLVVVALALSLAASAPMINPAGAQPATSESAQLTVDYFFAPPDLRSYQAPAKLQSPSRNAEMLLPEQAVKGNKRVDEYVSVNIEGLPQWSEPGLPVLPFKTARILLPPEVEFQDITVTCGDKVSLPGSHLVEPGQQPLPLSYEGPIEPTPLDEEAYDSSAPSPGRLYSDVTAQNKMGYMILLVNLHPVEYIPVEGKLSYYERMTVTVTLGAASEDNRLLIRGLHQDMEIVEDMVDNPGTLKTYRASPISFQQSPLLPPADYEYVIITSAALNATPGPNNFQALRDNKISRGINATIVTTEWIYTNYNGTRPDSGEDNQTKIRNFIIDAYYNWSTQYVLLGGDGDGGDVGGESGDKIIPHRGFSSLDDDDIPADMYYACLNGTFDYNANGIYGEPDDGPGGGEVDLLAEVYVGRAPVDSQSEVQNFVQKTLAYQNITSTDENLRKVWMVGEKLGFGGPSEWGGNYKDEIKEGSSAHGYTTVGFEDSHYATDFDMSTLYDRDNNWSKSEIISVINNNTHLINHLGHADGGKVMKMYNPDVDGLTNDELYFIGYSQGCYAGSFDNRDDWEDYTSYDCISEHLTMEAHGAVAFISNSRYGWGAPSSTDGPSQHFDREFWDAVFGEVIPNIGIANQDSKEDNAGRISNPYDRWCYYEINLFGDPELSMKLHGGVVYHSHEIDDSAGDGDTCPEPGESIKMPVTLWNIATAVDFLNVNATLWTTDPYINITDDFEEYGNIPAVSTAPSLDDYDFDINATCPDDHTVTFNLNITALGGGPWTGSFNVTIVKRYTVSGQVRDLNTSDPIVGAAVYYDGAVSGNATTNATGNYTVNSLPGDNYTFYATATNYSDSDPVNVTVPPDASGIDFELGCSDINVTPTELEVWVLPDETKPKNLTIANLGNYNLSFNMITIKGEPVHTNDTAETGWAWVVPTLDGNISAGEWDDAVAVDITAPGIPGPVTMLVKNDYTHLYIAFTDTNDLTHDLGDQVGIYFDEDHDGLWQSPPSSDSEGNFWIWDSGGGGIPADIIFQSFTDETQYPSPPGVSGALSDVTGYMVYEVAIEFNTSPLDCAIGDIIGLWVYCLDYPIRFWYNGDWPESSSYSDPSTYGDLILSPPCPWLTMQPPSGTVAPVNSTNVSAVFNATGMGLGDYHCNIIILNNDPDENPTIVPATMHVCLEGVYYDSYAINDSIGGNNNTYPEPGESAIKMPVTLRNTDPTTNFSNVNATLSTADPYINITDNYEEYYNITINDTAICEGYYFNITPGCPGNYTVTFNLSINASNGGPWTDSFEVVIMGYTLTMAVAGSGTTTPAVGAHGYPLKTTVVNVSATPSGGWYFSSWSGGLSGNTNPTNITVDSDKSVTAHFSKKSSSSGGGGGGGGGGGDKDYYISVDMLGDGSKYRINDDGNLSQSMEVSSEDGRIIISLSKDAACLDRYKRSLASIMVKEETDLPALSENHHILDKVYKLEPAGANFNPGLNLTMSYEDNNTPQYVSEEGIYIAYYNAISENWSALSSRVDTQNNTVTAQVTHFTTFAIIGIATPPRAEFTITGLDFSSELVKPKQEVIASVDVKNFGNKEGNYTVNLTINGKVEQTKTITLAPQEAETVNFTISKDKPGSYIVFVDGSTGEFTVMPLSWFDKNWFPIGVVVMALGTILFYLIRRSREQGA